MTAFVPFLRGSSIIIIPLMTLAIFSEYSFYEVLMQAGIFYAFVAWIASVLHSYVLCDSKSTDQQKTERKLFLSMLLVGIICAFFMEFLFYFLGTNSPEVPPKGITYFTVSILVSVFANVVYLCYVFLANRFLHRYMRRFKKFDTRSCMALFISIIVVTLAIVAPIIIALAVTNFTQTDVIFFADPFVIVLVWIAAMVHNHYIYFLEPTRIRRAEKRLFRSMIVACVVYSFIFAFLFHLLGIDSPKVLPSSFLDFGFSIARSAIYLSYVFLIDKFVYMIFRNTGLVPTIL